MKQSRKKPDVGKKLFVMCLILSMLLTTAGSALGISPIAEAAKAKKMQITSNVILKCTASVRVQKGKKITLKLKKKNIRKIKGMKWSSKNKNIARITNKGRVTGVRAGKTTITCKLKYLAEGAKKYKKKTLRCKVIVTEKNNIKVTPKPQPSSAVPTETPKPDTTMTTAPATTPTPATGETNPTATPTPATGETNPTATPTPAAGETNPTATPTASPTKTPATTPTPGAATSALAFASQLGAGINIGNSLDSYDCNEYLAENNWAPTRRKEIYISGNEGLKLETSWGNPQKISREFLHGIKTAGFQTVRLPVSYVNHVKTETVNGKKVYTIDEAWLNRVQQIVDWALAEELFVIINLHHDGADTCDNGNLVVCGNEQATWLSPLNHSGDAYTQMEAKFVSLWTQIATKFVDYSDHLLFADMNEFHHGYNNPETSWCTAQNELHQAFVDTVRNTGGNNRGRYLIVPGYNTNIDHTVKYLTIPTDIAENRTEYNGNTVGHIIVEVHYYDPFTYAGDDPSDTKWGSGAGAGAASWGMEDFLETQMAKMNTHFVKKGVPVIIGEFGAPAHNIDAETDRQYRTYYYSCVVRAAVRNGINPIAWDNGTTYVLLSRDGSIAQPSIVEAIIKYTKTPSAEISKPTS